jgi:DNA repair protein RAD50
VKKTTRSQKTLEGSLVCNNNGERTTISTRVAHLDEYVPRELGVSQAILDAVIFCHQDESLWPMSEPSALKKRFDEIFEALRYTKAIENLKLLRKKQGEELSRLKIFEEQEKINKEKGDRAEKRSLALQADIESSREKCEEITIEMEETQQQIKLKHEQANSFLSIVQDLKNKRDQLDYRQDAVVELKMTLEELSDDDKTLEDNLAQYEERMATLQSEAEQNKAQYTDLQSQLGSMRKEIAAKLADKGRYQSDKEKYERQIASRMEMIREAARIHGFRGFDGELNNNQVISFNERIQKLLAEKRRDLERLQKENAAALDQATGAITDLEGRKAARTQDRVFAKQRMGAIEKRTNVLQNESNLLDVDEGGKAILDSQFDDIQTRLLRTSAELENAGLDSQIQQENEKLWQLESENEKLGRELVECTRLASDRAQLDLRKKELTDRKRRLETLTSTWNDKLTTMMEGSWQPETVESQFQATLKQQIKAVTDARVRRDAVRERQQNEAFKLKNVRDSQKKKTDQAAKCQAAVLAALRKVRDGASIDDYLDEVAFYENEVAEYKDELSLFDALADYYNKCQKYLDSKDKCLLCDRLFDTNQGASRSRLAEKIKKHLDPKKKQEVEKDMAGSRAILDALQGVRSEFDTHERLMAELPGIKDDCKALEATHDALERQLEEQDALVATQEEMQQDLESMNKTVLSISQIAKEIKESETQIDRVMSQQLSGVATKSADEIHDLQAACAEQMRVVKGRVAKLTADKQRLKDQLNALELEKSELNNKINNALRQLERKKDFQSQIQTLKDEHSNQRELIATADQDLESIEPQIAEARTIRDDTLQRGRGKEQVVSEERDSVANSVSELRMIESDIKDYVDRGGPSNLASNQRAITGLERSIAGIEKEISTLTVQTNKLKQDIDNGDRKKKNISDNLNYRKNLRVLEVLRRDIEDLESRNAHEDYEQLVAEARALESANNKLLAERGSIMGSMKTKDEELGRLLTEWEMDYKDAARKYRESHIKVETTRAAIEDLGRYGSALDKAIMQYHSLKMEEVNRIAGELWQSTYQGTDIDTILIRSDAETATGKRNYNYRVCMVKQDTEMDMRGRCSAGQKVLASIIIRLALAESFGVNCGLIALDEPTTNLDRDNIKSLAESLHAIIKARQAQSNFQLIVITHDEEFLRHMRCSDFCDSYFRVRRDDRQNSVITRESITKVL